MKLKQVWKIIIITTLIVGIEILICYTTYKNYSAIYQVDFLFLIKEFFIYTSTQEKIFFEIDWIAYIAYFSCLLFSIFYLGMMLYGATKKYRSLILLRYESSKKFLNACEKKGRISALILAVVIALIPYIFARCAGSNFKFSSEIWISYMVLFLNIFLFLVFEVEVIIFFVIRYTDVKAIIVSVCFLAIALNIDLAIEKISIVTYGNVESLAIGSILIGVLIVAMRQILYKNIKKYDLL